MFCSEAASHRGTLEEATTLTPRQQPGNQKEDPSKRGSDEETAEAGGELWSEAAQLQEARDRASWHEKMSRRNIEHSEPLQVSLDHTLHDCP